ncbi:hypothetical protein ACSVH2_11785 [Flavobacterium sp. RSB2_4_14]|uniref:hypothetical protein n=1 Tax=Flavobacterium sp. RSB2_4_14 TaxID=3447665 RepID=UPI003F3384A1
MQNFRRLIDFYIQSSLHVGLAVVSLVYVTVFSNDLSKHIVYPSCVFFGTILSYNFLKYFEVFRSKNFHSNTYYRILGVSFLAGIGFLFCFFWLQRSVQIHILISGLFVLLYPFLRKYGWLKLFLVSFVVTYVTVYIPYQTIKWLPLDFYADLLQRFLILTSLLIPFEIMDSKTDANALNTLPQLFGITQAKLFGILLVIPFMVLEFLKHSPSYLSLIIGMVTVLFIHFTTLYRNKYFTSFWVESVPIFWLILLILFQ